jgi:DNA (cytosine-5)-methyltransferase 1
MNELALFAGAGGGILGGHLLGWRTVCAVEWEPYPASVLCARQNDGLLPPFPVWDDVQTFDGKPWRGIVDVVSGGFPCQDISAAGKGAGIDGERSGMWREMARIIHEVRPQYVFVENSPMLTSRGLGRVLGDLASMGFDAKWGVLGAADVGAPHQRDRIWIIGNVANPTQLLGNGGNNNTGKLMGRESVSELGNGSWQENVADPGEVGLSGEKTKQGMERGLRSTFSSVDGNWWEREPESTARTTQPGLGGMANGMASRVDRLKAIGNGQVSEVARRAWEILSDQR